MVRSHPHPHQFMKSLLEINPGKLVSILLILGIVAIPLALLWLGIHINPVYWGALYGLGMVIFFWLIYPRITRNKEYLRQVEEEKFTGNIARQLPGFNKVRIVGILILLLIFILGVYLYFLGKLYYLEGIAPILVFSYMVYYAKFLRQNKQTAAFGERLANIEKLGAKKVMKTYMVWGIVKYVLIIIVLLFFYLFLKKETI